MYSIRESRTPPAPLLAFESGTSDSRPFKDRHFKCDAVKVLPGEFCVSNRDLVLITTLGSCVAACIRDPLAGVGGMNHFLLPSGQLDPASATARYGGYAMEMLINELIKRGASRPRLEAKVFGGGNVIRQLTNTRVGDLNAEFVLEYVREEGIALLAQDLGGPHPRKVYYWPLTGRAMVRSLPIEELDRVDSEERYYMERLRSEPVTGDVELFQ